jgi:acetolactate decarboxylase
MNLLCFLTLSASVLSCLDKPPKRSIHVWSGECRHWGAMREVMHEGKTRARISLDEATQEGRIYAVGALANLAGEVFIEGGDVWVSRVVAANQQETRKLRYEELESHSATLLIAAHVPALQQLPVEADVPPGEVEAFLAAQIKDAGWDVSKPTPLLIVGPFIDVQGHIVNGACLHANGQALAGTPPFEASFPEIWGRVVGFYAEGQEGLLTHHGSKVHLHFLSDDEPRLMMHADKLGLKKGSVLFLPVRERQHPVIPQKGN